MTDIIDALYDAQPEEDDAPPPEVPPPAPTAEEPAERIAPLTVLSGVLFRPARTFERLRDAKNGHWWLLFGLAALGVILVAVLTTLNQQEAFQAALQAQAETNPDFDTSASSTFLIIGGVFGGAVAVFGLAISYGIRAGVAYGLGLAFGGKVDFLPAFRMALWSALPEVLGTFVTAAALLFTGQSAAPGLSAALTTQQTLDMPVLTALLSNIDVYTLWSAVLLAVGVSITARISRGRGAVVSALYYVLVIGVSVGFAALSAALATGFTG